jgi:hypothetical protein
MDEMTLTLKRIAWLDGTILPDYYDVVFNGGIRDGKPRVDFRFEEGNCCPAQLDRLREPPRGNQLRDPLPAEPDALV